MPYDELVLTTLAQVPTLLVFPLVLFATRFFTAGERERIAKALYRMRGRGETPRPAVAGPAAGAAPTTDDVPAQVDRTTRLSADDIEAEEEELEMEKEADVDFIEGPSSSTIT
jgi:hypothetical protein